ncbi:dethiobiotin synthase [Salinivibrio sp. MA607]|uniref:dethiobiotin synthase n=1 Tax=Salinivibrio sp. MA607 TaxID=1909457 RepID=UPI00098920C8|nr:dethiobiotin synthase [Salinivibrio sp. MA607]OOF05751.1 dethiobiotin synthase [Salinivibrio sp. MA607]
MHDSYFITGTDTEVGKTYTTAALLHAFIAKGYQAVGYKPVAAGADLAPDYQLNSDAVTLQRASAIALPYAAINPVLLETPCSPHWAAALANTPIDTQMLSDGLVHLKQQARPVLVEGAGGWQVPLSETETLADWVVAHQLPVIMVVGIKLGCLNHALLTAEAIRARGLELAGWVANTVDPKAQHSDEMVRYLNAHLDAPYLGHLPFAADASPTQCASHLDVSRL